MRYSNVFIESLGYCLPEEVVTTEEIEERLQPTYQRLRLPEGRLELMTGIRERRFWKPAILPSDKSIESCRRAIAASSVEAGQIGALVHGSVCRDHLEPATACRVHCEVGLPDSCVIYDVSNACLGVLNGIVQVANMIELGQIEAGLVVGTEDGRQLVDTTIDWLNAQETLTRSQIKLAVASLTIGSASCAVLITNERLSSTGNQLHNATIQTNTTHHRLCHSGRDEAAGDGMKPLMETDSEQLMNEGIETGEATFQQFLHDLDWLHDDVHKTVCHQVGGIHRKLMLERLGLNPDNDYPTFPWLGNTGSVALPITLALALEGGNIEPEENVALLGIGSGINCLMLGATWQKALVEGEGLPVEQTATV